MQKYWRKFLNLKYGAENIRTVLLLPFGHFSGFLDSHLPVSHLKSTFEEVWNTEADVLRECCKNRFRAKNDVTQWLMKNWRFCQGRFEPRGIKWGKSYAIGEDQSMIKDLRNQKFKAVCLNDCNPDLDFEYYQKELQKAFEAILPEKSSFEL